MFSHNGFKQTNFLKLVHGAMVAREYTVAWHSRLRPTVKTVQVWSEEATSMLQDCFEHTEWEVFKEGADLEKYTTSVLAYVHFCTDTVLTTKTIRVFPNQKPWLDSTVCMLLKARDAAYRSGDMLVYSRARRDLNKGIKEAKHRYKQRIEGLFDNNNPQSMWRGIRTITDYKCNRVQISHDRSLPDTSNQFFA